MFSWLHSTFSNALPSIPLNLQHRFLSFVLKRALGRFVHSDQLDAFQIDTQIRNGKIEISNIHLATNTVNEAISDLPFRLEDGFVGKITVHVPWANIWSAPISIALESFNATLSLIGRTPDPSALKLSSLDHNLSQSVSSVAENFVHQELDQGDGHGLQPHEPVTPNQVPTFRVPGGLDPFVMEEEEFEGDVREDDMQTVSIFASLTERLIARLNISLVNAHISIIDEERCKIALFIPDFSYGAVDSVRDDSSAVAGRGKSLRVQGVSVTMKNLAPQPMQLTSSPVIYGDSLNTSDSSDDDDAARMIMSQSIISLPPQPSVYQSAPDLSLYSVPHKVSGRVLQNSVNLPESTMFSMTELVANISPVSPASGEDNDPGKLGEAGQRVQSSRQFISIDVQLGTIACAFQSYQLCSLLSISRLFSGHEDSNDTSRPSKPPSSPSSQKSFEASLRLRSLVGVFLLDSEQCESASSVASGGCFPIEIHLSRFFQKPHSNLPFFRHLRVQADELEVVPALKGHQYPLQGGTDRLPLRAKLADFHISFINPLPSEDATSGFEMECVASPIALFDVNLSPVPSAVASHNLSRVDSPLVERMFPVDDITRDPQWVKQQGSHFKPSAWRKPHPLRKKHQNTIDPPEQDAAIVFREFAGEGQAADLSLLPLHLFVDLDILMHLVPFIDEVSQRLGGEEDTEGQMDDDNHDDDPMVYLSHGRTTCLEEFPFDTPRPRQAELPLVDSKPPPTVPSTAPSGGIVIRFKVVRLEMRTPPTLILGQTSPRRSGALMVDICGFSVMVGSKAKEEHRRAARKYSIIASPPTERQLRDDQECASSSDDGFSPAVRMEWHLICVAFTRPSENAATGILSIGPLTSSYSSTSTRTRVFDAPHVSEAPVFPNVSVSRSEVLTEGDPRSLIDISAKIPLVRVSLDKLRLDLVQLWADDVAQWTERLSNTRAAKTSAHETFVSNNTSLIGSRFFSRRPKSMSSSFTMTSGANTASSLREPSSPTEVCIKCSVTEGSIQLWIPRLDALDDSNSSSKPMNADVFEVSTMITSKPRGKDEMIIRLSVMDVQVFDAGVNGEMTPIFHLTTPRFLDVDPTPMVKVRFASVNMSDKAAKESRIKVSLWGSTYQLVGQGSWFDDVSRFVKAPEGAFESVVPSERTVFSIHLEDVSVKVLAILHPGSLALAVNNAHISADLVGQSPESRLKADITSAWLFCIDTLASAGAFRRSSRPGRPLQASDYWKRTGFAPLVELSKSTTELKRNVDPDHIENTVTISSMNLLISMCADSMLPISSFISEFSKGISPPAEEPKPIPRAPPMVSRGGASDLLSSLDEHAFQNLSELGETADMVNDDLPSNPDYLDTSFGAAAGVRDIVDEDLDETEVEQSIYNVVQSQDAPGSIVSTACGETIRIFDPNGLNPVEHYFDSLVPEDLTVSYEKLRTVIRAQDCNVTLSLHSGFDWHRTRRIVDDEVRVIRRRLLKLRQLLATGRQVPDDSIGETHAVLFNSVYIGIRPEVDANEPNELVAAIDEELQDDLDETATQSSWQSLHREPVASNAVAEESPADEPVSPSLKRSRHPSLQFCFTGVKMEYDGYGPESDTASRLLVTSKDAEILDHIKTSTWRKFLTQMREDSNGNVRETGSDMLRIELSSVRPARGNPSEEARLKAKILPLRLHVDQDALDFIKKFFAFTDPDATQATEEPASNSGEIYFQHIDIFPVEIKLDYKPKRVDYRALKEGQTLELMNFFHFDGSEMTLRHIEMFGVTGWARMFNMLNDLWSPDVKANQLADVISGIEPIRSVVNVGSGVADLVLLPIKQYKKDGRIIRGLQKGTTSFVKSTAMEAIRLGARLANGTQIILEHTENVLGGAAGVGDPSTYAGAYEDGWTRAEVHGVVEDPWSDEEAHEDLLASGITPPERVSRYANQPRDVREGLQSAYVSLGRNLQSAAQTILAVPMEVYERSRTGSEGPVRAVVRAVPIAVLKPMIGASEAVSKTLLGLRNTLDPGIRRDIDEKYKKK